MKINKNWKDFPFLAKGDSRGVQKILIKILYLQSSGFTVRPHHIKYKLVFDTRHSIKILHLSRCS